jgi:nitrate reductase gamma subunit
MYDLLLFGALPYVAITLFLLVTVTRYRMAPYTFSTLSSQFMETKQLFWGSVPFHVGLTILFFGHLLAFLLPRHIMLWNAIPLRLFILESSAFAAAVLTLFGLGALVYRRGGNARLRVATSKMDVLVYSVLLYMLVTGIWVATTVRWGSGWATHTLAPYLLSVFKFAPEIDRVAQLPLIVKFHVVGAWVLVALFGFTRLVHALVAPVPFLWRPVQQVIWNWKRDRDQVYGDRSKRTGA